MEQSLVEALVFFHQTLDGLDLVIFVAFQVSDLLVEFSDFRQRQLDVFAFERVSRSGKVPEVQRVPGEFLDLDGVVAVVVGVDEDGRKLLLKKISKVLFFFQVKTHKLCKQSYINIVYNIYF